jgi:predicted dehydrogenase
MSDVPLALAGVGYWGSKLARNIQEASGCRLALLCDREQPRLDAALQRYPSARGVLGIDQALADKEVRGVVLATPAALHGHHTRLALEADKHVLVEKPLALSTAECDQLGALAEAKDLALMVGHTFIYSEPVRKLRQLIETGDLGQVLYVYAQRLNLGVIREDLNALWNFGPHDVSILLYLLGGLPSRVSARQFSLLNRELEDVVFLVLEFPEGVVGHIHESWLDPRKIRQLTVVGDRKMAVYDDTDFETPIRIYDKGVVSDSLDDHVSFGGPAASEDGFGEFKLQVRAGDMLAPRIPGREPLRVEIEHFVDCVSTGRRPLTDAAHGRDVVAVLEAAERSAQSGGAAIRVTQASLPARF